MPCHETTKFEKFLARAWYSATLSVWITSNGLSEFRTLNCSHANGWFIYPALVGGVTWKNMFCRVSLGVFVVNIWIWWPLLARAECRVSACLSRPPARLRRGHLLTNNAILRVLGGGFKGKERWFHEEEKERRSTGLWFVCVEVMEKELEMHEMELQ